MRLVCGENKILLSPCHCPGILLLGLALQCSVLMTVGIRLENVTVPSAGQVGQSVSLHCQWQLEKNGTEPERLYSLKWYKDGDEFYRYLPHTRPSILTFPVNGVQVDQKQLHNVNQVTLRNLSLNSTGSYKCEISSESPRFQTLQDEKGLAVYIPPSPGNPRLSAFPSSVYMRDILSGNCTSYRSYPAANLSFYINERLVTGPNLTLYETTREKVKNGRNEDQELWTSALGLRIRVDNNLFVRGLIRVKCRATIFGKIWESTKNITHLNKNYQPPIYSSSASHSQYSSASRIKWWHWTFLVPLLSALYGMLFQEGLCNLILAAKLLSLTLEKADISPY